VEGLGCAGVGVAVGLVRGEERVLGVDASGWEWEWGVGGDYSRLIDRRDPSQQPTHPPNPPQLGGSGVLVQPMTYIFDEEPERWHKLLETLGMDEATARAQGLLVGLNVNGNGNGKVY